jgi:hypothetical protein
LNGNSKAGNINIDENVKTNMATSNMKKPIALIKSSGGILIMLSINIILTGDIAYDNDIKPASEEDVFGAKNSRPETYTRVSPKSLNLPSFPSLLLSLSFLFFHFLPISFFLFFSYFWSSRFFLI